MATEDVRETIQQDILSLNSNNILLQLATGVGKTKQALDFIFSKHTTGKILVVVPRLVLIENWRRECIKWGYVEKLQYITFSTYLSLYKQAHLPTPYEYVIYDECHHLSENCLEHVPDIKTTYSILLSATVTLGKQLDFQKVFPGLVTYKFGLKQAINTGVLPEPLVFLLPLTLDYLSPNVVVTKHPKATGGTCELFYSNMWKFLKDPAYKNMVLKIKCTEQQYYREMSNTIKYYKDKSYLPCFKNKMLKLSLERIKWLAEKKTAIVSQILDVLADKRVITFCASIKQTEELGQNCIHSKNKDFREVLEKFQNKQINHITACDMLNEGSNLNDCEVGVFACLNSSELMIAQRNGRLLRHNKPIIIIPYYVGTRDAEIVKEMTKDFDPKNVCNVSSVPQLESMLKYGVRL